ncbi:MAG: methionyl-tRNA formyltransferase [Akkermansiaceae bacterium]
MAKLRIVFMATGDIALPSLQSMFDASGEDGAYELVALVTQPDKPVGRKQVLTAPAVKELALSHHIPVLQPESAADRVFLAELAAMQPDIIVVMAYGQILPQALLDIPSVAIINLHASLLPKYRGAACIQAPIDAGDSHTGITVMHVVKALDAGDIILKREFAIGEHETGGELHDRLADLGPEALMAALQQLADGIDERTPQDPEQVSYVSKLLREDGELDWSQSAEALERRTRAYDPWPGTSTTYRDKKGRLRRLKIFPQVEVGTGSGKPGQVLEAGDTLRVACGEGCLVISSLQADGSRRMSAADFMLASPLGVGDILGED